jgi:3-dehydroquinate dehydratase II
MHGVNLDQIGRRDPQHYGGVSLDELERRVAEFARELGLEARFFHSNHEGEFVEHLHRLEDLADGVIINAGAWTHYSWAIRDALELFTAPVVEVHLSNIAEREEWRRFSVVEDIAAARFIGKGPDGYREALEYIVGSKA